MNFCEKCDNMYYISISSSVDEKSEADNECHLIYYCKNCGNTNNELNQNNICVSKTIINNNKQNILNNINEFTKYDPSLPRTNTIKCPNNNCPTNNSSNPEQREIIYMRIDDINKKYIYLCSSCNCNWNLNDS